MKRLFIIVLLMAGIQTAFAADFSAVSPSGHILYYHIYDPTNHIVSVTYPGTSNGRWTGYTKPVGNITIPSTVTNGGNTYTVTIVGDYAFEDCSGITNVVFPNTLVTIGSWAFDDCSISSITIPEGVKRINWAAFYGNPISSVNVSNSVEFIDHSAFSGGTWLNSKPNGIVYLGKVAYTYKGVMPNNTNLTFNSDTKCITAYFITSHTASNNEKVASVTLPDSLLYIGMRAFYGCGNISQISIPQKVRSIGQSAFSQCGSLTTVYYNAINAVASTLNNYYVFSGCENLTTANIGNSVMVIPACLFAGCTQMTNINMSESVTKIGASAFANTAITSFTISRNMDSIGSGVFSGCSSLQTIYYNAINCSNSQQPFTGANNVTNIIWGNEVQTIPDYLCYNMTGLQGCLSFPNSIRRIGYYAFVGCTGLVGVLTLPSNLEYIGGHAFYGCTGLTGNLVIGNSVHYIGSYAFYNCNNITNLSIGMNVDTMQTAFANMNGLVSVQYNATNCQDGQHAFSNDQQLSSINFGNNVQSIPDNTVVYLPNITTIALPEGLRIIGQTNFSSLNISGTITLPSTLQEIGYMAFSSCGNPSQIVCNAITPPTVNTPYGYSYIFVNHYNVPLYVPCGSIESYHAALGWNAFANINGIGDCGYTVEVSSNNPSMGYVQGGGTYNQGETCTLTAVPYSGFHFDHWQDNNTQNPRTITVTGNATYTAYFVATQGIDNVITDAVNVYTLGGQIVVETDLKDEISIYDIVGRKVNGGRKTRFDVPASGVYLVKIGSLPTQKVVVVK